MAHFFTLCFAHHFLIAFFGPKEKKHISTAQRTPPHPRDLPPVRFRAGTGGGWSSHFGWGTGGRRGAETGMTARGNDGGSEGNRTTAIERSPRGGKAVSRIGIGSRSPSEHLPAYPWSVSACSVRVLLAIGERIYADRPQRMADRQLKHAGAGCLDRA